MTQIVRRSSGKILWNTSLGGLTFSDQFLQIATYVPEDLTVYGFGETEHDKLKVGADVHDVFQHLYFDAKF